METKTVTVMINASGSWALLGRFPDSIENRVRLNAVCGEIHAMSDRHTHFKMVDKDGRLYAKLRDGAKVFELVENGGL